MTQYKTSDIVLAAFLRLSGCQMLGIEKQGSKGTFVFAEASDELIRTYDLGQAQVEPVAFNNTIKQLTTSVRRMD
ncbi:hypothetical protein E4H12_10510 [Candidatus Thorarchaeota archaeon]|nr:MAG: hypothetical protein E4H12_10510 [Candidatus Thorarchaeota archaeon]